MVEDDVLVELSCCLRYSCSINRRFVSRSIDRSDVLERQSRVGSGRSAKKSRYLVTAQYLGIFSQELEVVGLSMFSGYIFGGT